MAQDGHGYGVTYKWNEEGTEAFLLGGGASQDIEILDEVGRSPIPRHGTILLVANV